MNYLDPSARARKSVKSSGPQTAVAIWTKWGQWAKLCDLHALLGCRKYLLGREYTRVLVTGLKDLARQGTTAYVELANETRVAALEIV
jgi:hypothetical protein